MNTIYTFIYSFIYTYIYIYISIHLNTDGESSIKRICLVLKGGSLSKVEFERVYTDSIQSPDPFTSPVLSIRLSVAAKAAA